MISDETLLGRPVRRVGVPGTPGPGPDLAALCDAQWHALVRLAVLLVDDLADAEDVVQDAFLALHRKRAGLRNSAAAVSYLRTSVVNGARSRLRRRAVARRHLASEMAVVAGRGEPAMAGAEDAVVVAAEHAHMIAALRALPRRQREVLVLRYWSGLSEAEIADTLHISKGTVKSAASRGLDTLERSLGELS